MKSQLLPALSYLGLVIAVGASAWGSTPARGDTPPATASAPAPTPPVASQSSTAETPVIREVSLISPKSETWPEPVEVHGNVMPWQEMRINTETGGLRLLSVLVDTGDRVEKGQPLAVLDTASLETELEAVNAQLMEAQATLTQAEATLDRAKRLAPSGGVSQQELAQFDTQKQTAAARLAVAQVRLKAQQRKLDATRLLAPDDGLISARAAEEGDIVGAGSELFRLIRDGRLEWRAEVPGDILLKLAPGQEATISSPLGDEVRGVIRKLSPTIDLRTRKGLVYVDLPAGTPFKAGLSVGGTITLQTRALALPASAIQNDGDIDRVFTVTADNRLQAVKVKLGRSQDDRREIVSGLTPRAKVVAGDVSGLKAGMQVSLRK